MNLIEAGTDEYSELIFKMSRRFTTKTQADDAAEQARQPAAVADAGDQARTARRAAFARLALAHFDLQKLDGPGGEFAPALHAQQMLQLQPMLAQRRDQGVGGGHRVLNRQVDAHAADR